MKKKVNTTPKKTKRWRPATKFTSQKPTIKRDKPWRPRKNEQYNIPQIPEKKPNKVKDGIILWLFILSFLVFWFSLYINQQDNILSQKTTTKTITKNNKIEETSQIFSGNIESWNNENNKIEHTPTNPFEDNEKAKIIENFYWAIINNKEDISTYVDTPLRRTDTFKIYFREKRLNSFIENIDPQSFSFTITSIDETKNEITYNIYYSINGVDYTEIRKATITEENNEYKIGKIMCITTGCSRMPFFNPRKYF